VLAYIGIAFVQFFVLGQDVRLHPGFHARQRGGHTGHRVLCRGHTVLYLAFGLAFQVPIVVVLLARMNIVSMEKLKEFRGYFIVLAFIIAAVVTPPDVVSQLALAIPMCLLYEVGIWAAGCSSSTRKSPDTNAGRQPEPNRRPSPHADCVRCYLNDSGCTVPKTFLGFPA
jgi:sec-independent protein translocase protein TatC